MACNTKRRLELTPFLHPAPSRLNPYLNSPGSNAPPPLPRTETCVLFAWIIAVWVHLMWGVRFWELFLGAMFSFRRGCLNVGSCFQCDYLPVTFGALIPGGCCIIKKTASLTIPGLSSKLRMTVCHSVYTNVWLASLINNGWCLAVNPQTPPPSTLAFVVHRENVSLPRLLPSCPSFLNRW